MSATIDPLATGTLTNTATVSSPITDPVPGNDSATDSDTLTSTADLSITKVDDIDPILAGNALTYTVTVNNTGPSDAQNVVVTDTLPSGVTFVSTTGCAEDPNGVPTCSLGDIPAGGSAQYTITVTVDPTTSGIITNQADVTSDSADPNLANNTVTEDTTVNSEADLSITKSDSPDPVTAGNNLTYTITVANAGPSDAQNVEVVDNLPAGTTFVSQTDSCVEAPVGTLTCSLGTILAGGNTSFDITVAVDPSVASGTVLTNSATVSSTTTDPNPSNDTVTEDTTVSTPPTGAPQVTDVCISGSTWVNPCFSLITGPDPNLPLPWINLDTIEVTFDQNVDVDINSLTLTGVNVSEYTPSGFTHDASTFKAMWTFPSAFAADQLLLDISDS